MQKEDTAGPGIQKLSRQNALSVFQVHIPVSDFSHEPE
jgi:hypothetical protein